MGITKYAMFVDRDQSDLMPLVPRLKDLNFEVMSITELTAAQQLIDKFNKLSLILIGSSIADSDAEPFVAKVRKRYPRLPILWCTADEELGAGTQDEPTRVLRASELEQLGAVAEDLLFESYYPECTADALVHGTQEIMRTMCKTDIEDPQAFLRANGGQLSDVTALLPFSHPDMCGQLAVSSSEHRLRQLFAGAFGLEVSPTPEQLDDLVGELANQILGKMKVHFEAKGVSFLLAVPVFIRGVNVSIRQKAEKPSLGIQIFGQDDPLYVEFTLENYNTDLTSVEATQADDGFESGELVFL